MVRVLCSEGRDDTEPGELKYWAAVQHYATWITEAVQVGFFWKLNKRVSWQQAKLGQKWSGARLVGRPLSKIDPITNCILEEWQGWVQDPTEPPAERPKLADPTWHSRPVRTKGQFFSIIPIKLSLMILQFLVWRWTKQNISFLYHTNFKKNYTRPFLLEFFFFHDKLRIFG